MRTMALLMLVVVATLACAQPKYVCYKPGLDQTTFNRDNFECMQASRTTYGGGGTGLLGLAMIAASAHDANVQANKIYKQCMEARGYTVREQGESQ